MTIDTVIQKYTPEYREAIRHLCCDATFMGLQLENAFCDREVYADLVTKYYTDHEQESCLVALDNNKKLAGYLIGCQRYTYHKYLSPLIDMPAILKGIYRFLTRQYDKKSYELIKWYFKEGHEQTTAVPEHSAHFHITLQPEQRSKGLGRKLVNCFENELTKNNIHMCYAQTISTPTRGAKQFFKKLGYKEYDKKPFTALKGFVHEETHAYTLVKEL